MGSSNLPDDTNGLFDVFTVDFETESVERVSVGTDGTQADDRSDFPGVSPTGRYVLFLSQATNLVAGDSVPDVSDIFVRDRGRRTTSVFSTNTTGFALNATRGRCWPGIVATCG